MHATMPRKQEQGVTLTPWEYFYYEVQDAITGIWLDEPWQISKIRLGLIDSGAGSGEQTLSILQGLETYLIGLGPDVLYRFIKAAVTHQDIPLDKLKTVANAIFFDYDDLFEKYDELGLTGFSDLIKRYRIVLDDPQTDRTGYYYSSIAVLQYIIRLHRWVHALFPWNFGVSMPQRTDAEIVDIYNLIQEHPTPPLPSSELNVQGATNRFVEHPIASRNVSESAAQENKGPTPPWMKFLADTEAAVASIWLARPWEIEKIRWGLINSGAGSGRQYFSDLVHLEIYLTLSGPVVLYRLTRLLSKSGSMDLPTVKTLLKVILHDSFDAFEFLKDLGLKSVEDIATQYWSVIDDTQTGKDEFIKVSLIFLQYINRMHSWVHSIYPWNFGASLPKNSDADIVKAFNLIKAHPTPG